jgi:hypothetical protein
VSFVEKLPAGLHYLAGLLSVTRGKHAASPTDRQFTDINANGAKGQELLKIYLRLRTNPPRCKSKYMATVHAFL